MSQADDVRSFVLNRIIRPARADGRELVTLRAGDVHRDMSLANAYPTVCSALRGMKLQRQGSMTLVACEGPRNGANVWFRFDLSTWSGKTTSGSKKPAPEVARSVSGLKEPLDFQHALALVSCSKTKLSHPAEARDLYCSSAFNLKRRLLESEGARWYILSAKYGAVAPSSVLSPYDLTLNSMGVADRKDWAQRVLPEILALAAPNNRIISFAGHRYVEHLLEPLAAHGVSIVEPLRGLRQGEQLAWLSCHQ